MTLANGRVLRLAAAIALTAFAAGPPLSSARAEPGCTNEAVRAQQGTTSLPDCRAYEMVSPAEKNGGDIRGIDGVSNGGIIQASADGSRVTYLSLASFGEPTGAALASQYLADRRAGDGWRTQNISLPMTGGGYPLGGGTPYDAFSTDLSTGLVYGGTREFHNEHLEPVANPPLADAPAGYENFYLRESRVAFEPGEQHLQALLTEAPNVLPEAFKLELFGATSDLGHVVVKSPASLSPGAVEGPGLENLYEWERATGLFQPVNVLPGGAPDPQGTLGLGGEGVTEHAISDDGASVIWTQANSGTLYVREHIGTPMAATVQVATGGPTYATASSDGTRIFYININGGLYEYDVSTAQTTEISQGAVAGVIGASEDGSYLYYVDSGYNLRLWHEGSTKFIAALSPGDSSMTDFNVLGVAFDWYPELGRRTARVTPDGSSVVFMSERSLTGYDNTVSSGQSCATNSSGGPQPAQCEEVFLYNAQTDHLSCVSCNPDGSRPTGPSGIPGGTEFRNDRAIYRSRVLSEDGSRVFFDSADALSTQDTNGEEDVYEYEAPGVGSCGGGSAVNAGGCVSLLSGGVSTEPSSFVDASANGSDVFFITRQSLLPEDQDQLVDLYDVRQGGGFPQPSVTACTGTGCQGVPGSPPAFATPSSATFNGIGNYPPPPVTHATSKPLTRAQKLAKALKACKKQSRRKRAACERHARRALAAARPKRKAGSSLYGKAHRTKSERTVSTGR